MKKKLSNSASVSDSKGIEPRVKLLPFEKVRSEQAVIIPITWHNITIQRTSDAIK